MAVPSAVRSCARRPLRASLIAIGLLLVLPQAYAQTYTPADPVLYWHQVAATAPVVVRHGGPYQQFRALAMVQLAVHDALNAIDPRFETYSTVPTAPASASPNAAVAAAAHDVVMGLIPPNADPAHPNSVARLAVQNAYTAALAAIADGTAENDGVAAGQAAAAAILATRTNDGSASPHIPAYVGANIAGRYQSTAPFGSAAPQFSNWAATAPFVVQSATQFHVPPGEIFDLSGDAYASEYNQVKQQGDARKRAAAPNSHHSDVARFWYHGGVDWHTNARLILPGFDLDWWQQARTLALMAVSMADSGIANAHSKYAYAFWRPVTAIRWANDGNPRTKPDPNWLPFITVPPYPDYPCGSTGAAGAATTALRLALGTNHAPFTRTVNAPALPLAGQAWPAGLPGVPAKAITRTYHSLQQAANEVGKSRVYAGIHFWEGCQAGTVQGEMTAEYIYPRILQPAQ